MHLHAVHASLSLAVFSQRQFALLRLALNTLLRLLCFFLSTPPHPLLNFLLFSLLLFSPPLTVVIYLSSNIFFCPFGSIDRWERSRGVVLDPVTLPKVREEWDKVCDFSTNPTYPTTNPELMSYVMTDLMNAKASVEGESSGQKSSASVVFRYGPKDAILYALSGEL
jgi:hypothetical protein